VALKIYNTLSGIIEELIPGGEKKYNIKDYPPVTIYSCGPTVYSYAHIGNFRTFLFNDFLRRYLKFRGFQVNHAMNITDVDDKTIQGARSAGITLKEYTEKFTEIFFKDLQTLNVEPVEHTPKATESIDAMIEIITNLKNKSFIYNREGTYYYNISKFADYGRLSRLDLKGIKSGLRYDTDEYEKDDIRDFALWKAPKDNEDLWETPIGKGRPGWHIECSAMIRKIFKKTIDIHTGGVDLIFPHHENEIAQSEAAYDEKFVRHWIHIEHLLVNGSKMSKSKNNFYTLGDLLSKGFSPRSIRYLLYSAHYKKQLNFTFEGLKQADQALMRIDSLIVRLKEIKNNKKENSEIEKLINNMMSDFVDSIDSDLNIAKGIGVFFEFIHAVNLMLSENALSQKDCENILDTIKTIDAVFGFIFFPVIREKKIDEKKIEKRISERIEAKKMKNFEKADEIRNQLLNEGIILEDTKDGTRWKITT